MDTTDDAAYELKDIVNKFIQENVIGIPKVISYAGVEASPWRKPLRKLGGMACGFMERNGIARGKLRPEFGPPVGVYEIVDGEPVRPELVKHTKDKGWEVMIGERLRALTGMEPDEFSDGMEE